MRVTWSSEFKPWVCAAADRSRPLLAGVLVDPAGWLVATDAHRLTAIPCEVHEPCFARGAGSVIVPAHLLRLAVSAPGKPRELLIGATAASVMTKHGRLSAPLVAGAFPKWWQILSAELPEVSAPPAFSLDPWLLAGVCEALGVTTSGAVLRWGRYAGPDRAKGVGWLCDPVLVARARVGAGREPLGLVMPAFHEGVKPLEVFGRFGQVRAAMARAASGAG